MEGFNSSEVDRILNLQDNGLRSAVVLPLGYRDSENDYLTNLKKVRRDDELFFIRK
jgi:nitroreductase